MTSPQWKPRHRTPTWEALTVGMLAGVLLTLIGLELAPSGEEPDIEHYREVRDFVSETYVREVSHDELLDHALHGMLEGLDRYSRYYDVAESTQVERETEGRYQGIGAVFRSPIADGRVLFTLPGSPAARGGLTVGDQLLTVEGMSIEELDEESIRAALSEPTDGILNLEIERIDGTRTEIEITPSALIDPTVRHARILDGEDGIGYVAITSFSKETPGEFDRTLEWLVKQGARQLVLDLRGNRGGVLVAAESIAKRFVETGRIVSTEGQLTMVTMADKHEAVLADLPLVILVDAGSASASEVLAGALQDHRKAVIIGSPTFGKGLVQKLRHYDDEGTIAKITSSYYYSPAGRSFENSVDPTRDWGLLPDVSVPLSQEETLRVHRFLARYGPPVEALPALQAWEQHEEVALIERHPSDPQLDVATRLLRGERPGPQPLAGDLRE